MQQNLARIGCGAQQGCVVRFTKWAPILLKVALNTSERSQALVFLVLLAIRF